MRGAHDARGTIDGSAEIIVLAAFAHTCVHAATYVQRKAFGQCVIRERNLRLDARDDCVAGILECCMHPVPRRLDDNAVLALDGLPEKPVVATKRTTHPLRLILPKARAALDVSKEEGRDGRSFDHGYARQTFRLG